MTSKSDNDVSSFRRNNFLILDRDRVLSAFCHKIGYTTKTFLFFRLTDESCENTRPQQTLSKSQNPIKEANLVFFFVF